MKIVLCLAILVLPMSAANAASLPGDSANGMRLFNANCTGCHDTSVLTRPDRAGSVPRCFEKADRRLRAYGEQAILRDRGAGSPKVSERPVLSFPVGVSAGPGCAMGGEVYVEERRGEFRL